MINGLAEQNLLLIMTERLVDNGDDLVKLLDMHVRIGAMLADEQRRFASYLPPQQKPAQAHARLAVNRDNADGTK
jgi:hypothetical protein